MINRPEYDAKSIGRNLKRLRKAKKLTVDEVRKYLGVGSVQAIYKYEAGKSYPPADAMFALMQLYEADLYDILCGCESRPSVTEREAAREWRQRGRRRCINYYRGYIVRKAG
ncbi:MAG: helix-turn-helix transcriptional regulator [Lachnospiraceae bacterium]|nr:helix-turn-helix transcriptional regulator [Lachnospiraceae bacterium]